MESLRKRVVTRQKGLDTVRRILILIDLMAPIHRELTVNEIKELLDTKDRVCKRSIEKYLYLLLSLNIVSRSQGEGNSTRTTKPTMWKLTKESESLQQATILMEEGK